MKRTISYLVLIFLILEFAGCATLKKKFKPKKRKKEERKEVVLALEEYNNMVDYHELYKKHYLLWQYWHAELISSLERSVKKQRLCMDQSLEHLQALRKYIREEKKKILDDYIKRMQKVRERLYGRSLNQFEKKRISKELEKLKRLIDKEYRYSEIKSYIKGSAVE